jgi:hypothetical protein
MMSVVLSQTTAMDNIAYTILANQALDIQADDAYDQLLSTLACYVATAELICLEWAQVRKLSQLYLTWPQLLCSPHFGTPWQQLYASQSDHVYITTMGFDVATFNSIVSTTFGCQWYETPIPRSDIVSRGVHPGA